MKFVGSHLLKLLCTSPSSLRGRVGASFSSSSKNFVAPVQTTSTSEKKSNDHDLSLSYVSYESTSSKNNQIPLVIHHALFGRKENFTSFGKKIHHLTKRSVLIPDARNHGNSSTCLNPSVKQMSDDLVHLLSQLGLEKACLLGQGTGGRVAMMTALTKPGLVDRLVLVSSSPIDTENTLARLERYREACYIVNTMLKSHDKMRVNKGIISSADGDNGVEFRLELDQALKATLVDRSERALFISNLDKVNIEALLNNPDMGRFPCLRDNTFTGPTLFITGEKQPTWENDAEVRSIKQLFPNSFFVKIPGAGHSVHTVKKDDLLAATVSFLQTEF